MAKKIGEKEVKSITIDSIESSTATMNELFDCLSSLNIPEAGLESFSLRYVEGINKAMDEGVVNKFVGKCKALKNFSV